MEMIYHMNYCWQQDKKTKLRSAFNNNMSTALKLSEAQISKIIQSGVFLGRLFDPLLKTGLPLIKNVIKPLAKSVLISLGLTAAASAADVGIHKIFWDLEIQL